jgi:ankyrin repeat protein
MCRLLKFTTSDSIDQSGEQPSEPPQLRVQHVPASGSLLDICTQDLFASLMMSFMGVLDVQETTIIENAGFAQLENPTVSAFARAYVDADLGPASDALLCLIPAFRSQFPLPSSEDMLHAVLNSADAHRKASEWRRAQNLLRWACEKHDRCYEDISAGERATFVKALRATGELYRWSLAHHTNEERKSFGQGGIMWMQSTYHRTHGHIQEISEILGIYQGLREKFSVCSRDINLPRDDVRRTRMYELLTDALQETERVEALYHLCFVSERDFSSKHLQSALPLAVRNDWNEVVDALLEMKASPSSIDEEGRSAISYCADLGYASYAKDLIARGAFVDQLDKIGRTPLLIAAEKGHHEVVELLLDTGHVNIEAKGSDHKTPLATAVEKGYVETATLLLEKGADPNAKDGNGVTPLLWAARLGYEAVVRLLLEKGADPNAKDGNGVTPLLWAARLGYEAVVRLLLEKGADANATTENGMTPLLLAARHDHEAVVRLLLEKGSDVNAKNQNGMTPLLWAAWNDSEANVRLLLKDADVTVRDKRGMTPLLWAALYGSKDIVRLLLEKGADITAKNNNGKTPLDVASSRGHTAITKLLQGLI